MSWAIIINRFCKLSGTILKAFAYLIYFIFPKLRFTIPKFSKAKIISSDKTLIPKNCLANELYKYCNFTSLCKLSF